jgi:hypothetical protein
MFEDALALGLIRDCNGPRPLETLVRYRGTVLAELFRALAALKGGDLKLDIDVGVAQRAM